MSGYLHGPFKKALRSAAHLIAHASIAMLIIGLIGLVQRALLWDGDPKLFDFLPLRYIFDVIDLAILLAFLIFGTIEAIKGFGEGGDE